MSEYSSVSAFEHDYSPSVKKFFEKMYPVSGSNLVHTLVSTLYRAKPECIEIRGNPHNNADGTRTYISLRIHVTNDYFINMHLYGAVRGSAFHVTESEIYMKEDGEMKTHKACFARPTDYVKPGARKAIW
jgi:hypothetical protein